MPDLDLDRDASSAASGPRGALPLPDGTRLLHIGPPKTGTTSLQAAFHAARADLLAQGVRYAGRTQHSRQIAFAGIRQPEYPHRPGPPPAALWDGFVASLREAAERLVVVSSEVFTDGDDDAMRRVVADLDPERVHVVVTLRPLARILASQWQQGLKGGLNLTLDAWLEEVFDGEGRVASRFWRRHRHDQLVERWTDTVGPERLTVVMVDDRDHGFILRSFEQLLGLRPGTLPVIHDGANRSMTAEEAETLRSFNIAFREGGFRSARAHGLRQKIVRNYVATYRPGPDAARIVAPPWALERAAPLADATVQVIGSSGVRVVGDLERLAPPTAAPEPDETRPPNGPARVSLPVRMRGALVLMRLLEPIAARRGRRPRTETDAVTRRG